MVPLSTIGEAVNFCHAAKDRLPAAESDSDAVVDARRGYSRIMPRLEGHRSIHEVTWHYQPTVGETKRSAEV